MPVNTSSRPIRKIVRQLTSLGAPGAILALAFVCQAQEPQTSFVSSIEVVRAATQADRVSIITQAMNFSDKDAEAFWPIYRTYEYERSALDDRRVAVIKEYARKYPNLTDAEAKAMAEQMIDCEARLATLKKRYFKKFNTVLPGLTVTKFFQLDHRMDMVMDMKVESSLPALAQPANAVSPSEEVGQEH